MLPSSFQNLSCAVLGHGVSGAAVCRRLLSEGARVSVLAKEPNLPKGAVPLSLPQEAGSVGYVFRSPGIRPDCEDVRYFTKRGARLSGEAELFLSRCPCPVLGITGSDGKTTTSALAAHLLRNGGQKVFLGGNIGNSLLDELPAMNGQATAVLELSSFQLADFTPHLWRAAITNLSPNHLNWHKSEREYYEAKRHIFAHAGVCVMNAKDALSAKTLPQSAVLFSARVPIHYLQNRFPCIPLFVSEGGVLWYLRGAHRIALMRREEFSLPGTHNAENLLCAMALCHGMIPFEKMRLAAKTFRGVPHRMENIGKIGNVSCFDSSIDTSPLRTETTLSVFKIPPVVIAGGASKGLSLVPLAKTLAKRARAAVLIGQTAEEIRALLGSEPPIPTVIAKNMRDAVIAAYALAKKEASPILLSPGCTSFDAYKSYVERGEDFAQEVENANNSLQKG